MNKNKNQVYERKKKQNKSEIKKNKKNKVRKVLDAP